MIYVEAIFIPKIMVALSQDSDCSLAMLLGFLGVSRLMSSREKEEYKEKWAIKVCSVLFPQAAE